MNENLKAVQIVSYSQVDENIIYHKENFESIVQFNNVNNLEIIVLVVAGPYRSGKSFLLNWFIDRLSKMENGTPLDEISGIPEDFSGFKYRSGIERETKGMLAYSKIFKVKLKETEKAFLLIDTQGTFDNESTEKENKILFSLSTLISSVQIYNVTSQLSKDKLENLELFSTYAKLFSDNIENCPFQSLIILIRDWKHKKDHNFGFEGGASYLNKKWFNKDAIEHHKQLLCSSFEDIKCFLMPKPGLELSEKGLLNKLKPLFKQEMSSFVCDVIKYSYSKEKRIAGVGEIKCSDLPFMFNDFIKHYKTTDIPDENTPLQATSEFFYRKLHDQCFKNYCDGINENNLDSIFDFGKQHFKLKNEVIYNFFTSTDIDKTIKIEYKRRLKVAINEKFVNLVEIFEAKNKKNLREEELKTANKHKIQTQKHNNEIREFQEKLNKEQEKQNQLLDQMRKDNIRRNEEKKIEIENIRKEGEGKEKIISDLIKKHTEEVELMEKERREMIETNRRKDAQVEQLFKKLKLSKEKSQEEINDLILNETELKKTIQSIRHYVNELKFQIRKLNDEKRRHMSAAQRRDGGCSQQ